jgi:hypothetical protein
MNETLKVLYDSFYTQPKIIKSEREIKDCHRQLVEQISKPQRRLLLKIMDESGHITDEVSLDSFICGFQLAWRLTKELNHYQNGHLSRFPGTEEDVCSAE